MVIEPGSVSTNSTSGTPKGRQNVPANPPSKQGKAETESSQPHSSETNVSLSTAGQNLAKLESELAKAPEVDDSKVAEVRASLANGSYKVDADRIADKMLDQDNVL